MTDEKASASKSKPPTKKKSTKKKKRAAPRTREKTPVIIDPPPPPSPPPSPPPADFLEPEELDDALDQVGVLPGDSGGSAPIEWQPEDLAWKCSCGQYFPHSQDFKTHMMRASLKEPGKHTSLGQWRPFTGEQVKAPFRETLEAAKQARDMQKDGEKVKPPAGGGRPITTDPRLATSITVVPRTMVIDYCAEFRAGMEAAIALGWMPAEAELQDFLRFCVQQVFADRNVALVSYVVLKQEEQGNGNGGTSGAGFQIPQGYEPE